MGNHEQWHHEQAWPDSCVPACMCMIQKWRGEETTEKAFHEPDGRSGNPIELVRTLPAIRQLRARNALEETLQAIDGAELVVVAVFQGPYIRWQKGAYPHLESRHGSMCAPGDIGGPLHAIVLTGHDRRGFQLLDPYFPAAGQPLRIRDRDLERCFTLIAFAAGR